MGARRRKGDFEYDYHSAPTEEDPDSMRLHSSPSRSPKLSPRATALRRFLVRFAVALPVIVLAVFGLLHILELTLGHATSIWGPDFPDRYLPTWGRPADDKDDNSSSRSSSNNNNMGSPDPASHPLNITRNVLPIPAHSHNDYTRAVPLFDALNWGLSSVEADVWLFESDPELYVGHTTSTLTSSRTLKSLYIDPLLAILDSLNKDSDFANSTSPRNGVFPDAPAQSLVLLIDFKTNGADLFPVVSDHLAALRARGYLSHWSEEAKAVVPRPITVVGTGNTPFSHVISASDNPHRDIFFDAPLNKLPSAANAAGSSYTLANSHYASVSFRRSIGWLWFGSFSARQMRILRDQIASARALGLHPRYWETPAWPASLRNYVWTTLVREGVDVLNIDDLPAGAMMMWVWREVELRGDGTPRTGEGVAVHNTTNDGDKDNLRRRRSSRKSR